MQDIALFVIKYLTYTEKDIQTYFLFGYLFYIAITYMEYKYKRKDDWIESYKIGSYQYC